MSLPPAQEWTLPGQGGVELFAQSWLPEGPPRDVVVIAHGYAEHGGRYGNVVERLLPLGYAVHAIDHRGHGRSGGRRGIVDSFPAVIEDFHGFVAKVRARHGGQKVKLIGHSMGGSVAFGYALRYPQDLSGLVLSGPAVGGLIPWFQRLIVRLLARLAPNLGVLDLPANAVSRDPAVVEAYVNDPLVTTGKVPARTVGELVGGAATYLERAPTMNVPVLIQHGAGDILVTVDANKPVYDAIGASDKTVKIYPVLYHEIYNEPERGEVLDDLVAWLDAHPAG